MRIGKWFCFFLPWLFTVVLVAQTMQDPPGIRWRKIETPHFQVVFPANITAEGQRVANTLEHLYHRLAKTLSSNHRRITVLLSNQSVVANGYVTLAPWMSEFYSMPMISPELGVNDWYNLLAVHEGRHMVQFEKLNQGFTKFAGVLFGQYGRAALSMLSVPLWYWEGDAVGVETALTNGGRGRQPAFDMSIRALLLSGIRVPYAKAYLGSFKDWYPSWYHLGYLLTTFGRREFGAEMWSRVLDRASRRSYTIYAFSDALKGETGKRIGQFYQAAMDDLEQRWRKQLKSLVLTPLKTVNNKKRRGWTNYLFPHYHRDGSIMAQKYGLAHILHLVRLSPDGTEREIKKILPLQSTVNRTSLSGDQVVWNEYVRDIRWGKRSYSSLVVYDLRKGKKHRLTHKTRFFDPALSPDGKSIATIEFTPTRACSLVILDSASGRETRRFGNEDNDLLWFPSWSPDGRRLCFIRQNMNGRALTLLSIDTGLQRDVIEPGWQGITFPVFFKQFILFTSAYSGIDNIHAVDCRTGKQFQVTSSKFGAIYSAIHPDGTRLAFNHYTIHGYDIAEMALDPESWTPIEKIRPGNINYFEPLIAQEQGRSVTNSQDIPRTEYPVQYYSPSRQLLNIHSWEWLPFIPDLAFHLVSTDKFNLFTFKVGPTYNLNEKTLGAEIKGVYSGFFPVIDFAAGYGGRSSSFKNNFGEKTTYGWRQSFARLGISLPLNLSRGTYRTSLSIGSHIGLIHVSGQEYQELYDYGNGNFLPVGYFLRFHRYQVSAIRDIHPPWGQSLAIHYQHTPWKSDYKGSLFSVTGELYFPGLLRHHSLVLSGGYEKQNPDNYHFASRMLFARGIDSQYFDTLYRLSLDYALPLCYPEWNIEGLFFLKRLRVNFFHDYVYGRSSRLDQHFHSAGVDLLFDFHLFDLPQMIEMGPRFIYSFQEKEFRLEWLIFGYAF